MIEDLPQLPVLPVPTSQPDIGPDRKEIFYPPWNCFCCHDSGIVNPHLATLVVPDYNRSRDRLPLCQNPGCNSANSWSGIPLLNLDTRFLPAICQRLDQKERSHWQQTRIEKFERALALQQRVSQAQVGKNLRSRSRTWEERALAMTKHQIAKNPENFEVMEESA